MAWERVENAEDFAKEGETVEVKLIGIDEKTGKLKLSRKVLLPNRKVMWSAHQEKTVVVTAEAETEDVMIAEVVIEDVMTAEVVIAENSVLVAITTKS